MKKIFVIGNVILLLWYALSMIGLKIGDKYLVTSAFKEEWIFILVPTVTFILCLIIGKIGRNIHLAWLGMWFITQFLSHEWYTIFGRGFMGDIFSRKKQGKGKRDMLACYIYPMPKGTG